MSLSKVLEKSYNSRVSEPISFNFNIKDEGFYLIKIIARAGAWWQQFPLLSGKYWLDEELRIFLNKEPVDQYFNGNSLYGTRQLILIFTPLTAGPHTLTFNCKGSPALSTVEIYRVFENERVLDLLPLVELTPEDTFLSTFISKKKKWITLISIQKPVLYLTVKAAAKDGSQLTFLQTDDADLQLKVNDKIQENTEPKSHRLWYWCGRVLKGREKTYEASFASGEPGILIDFLSDRNPQLSCLSIAFKIIPTVSDPKWTTEDFSDDDDTMLLARLILGEAENQPVEAKIGIGFTVLNRLKKQQSSWGFSVRDIIIKDNQYDGLWNKNTYGKVRDPLNNASEKRKQEWSESYEVAKNVLSRSVVDTVPGSTNFHSYTDINEFPFWATDKNYRGKIGKIYFYELEK